MAFIQSQPRHNLKLNGTRLATCFMFCSLTFDWTQNVDYFNVWKSESSVKFRISEANLILYCFIRKIWFFCGHFFLGVSAWDFLLGRLLLGSLVENLLGLFLFCLGEKAKCLGENLGHRLFHNQMRILRQERIFLRDMLGGSPFSPAHFIR